MDIKQMIMSLIDCLVGNQYHFAQLCSCSRHVFCGAIVTHFVPVVDMFSVVQL